jgi:large subunit ribosomal protein L35
VAQVVKASPAEITCFHVYNKEHNVPKMKTKRGAKKRFKISSNGRIKRAQAFKNHILTKKTSKTKRQLRGTVGMDKSDKAAVYKMMPYA